MGYSACLIFNLQYAPGLGKIEVSSDMIRYALHHLYVLAYGTGKGIL
jgi:hypothetical protein